MIALVRIALLVYNLRMCRTFSASKDHRSLPRVEFKPSKPPNPFRVPSSVPVVLSTAARRSSPFDLYFTSRRSSSSNLNSFDLPTFHNLKPTSEYSISVSTQRKTVSSPLIRPQSSHPYQNPVGSPGTIWLLTTVRSCTVEGDVEEWKE
jgi:hypothetical protein